MSMTWIPMVLMLLIGVAVGGVAGFSVGRKRSQEETRQPYGTNVANRGDVASLAEQLDAARLEISQLETSRAQLRAQLDGANQQLVFVKSQLAQAQQAEQIRIEHERERAAAQAETQRQEQARRLQEQSRVIEKRMRCLPHCATTRSAARGAKRSCATSWNQPDCWNMSISIRR